MVIHSSPECIRRGVRQSNSSIVPVSYDRNHVDGDITHASDHGRHRTRYAVIVHLSAKTSKLTATEETASKLPGGWPYPVNGTRLEFPIFLTRQFHHSFQRP